MEGIFILGPDSLEIVAEKINATRLDIPDDYASNLDSQIHDFIQNKLTCGLKTLRLTVCLSPCIADKTLIRTTGSKRLMSNHIHH